MSDVSAENTRHGRAWFTGFDHGWPWLLAGLLLLVSAGVFPSEARLNAERASVETLKTQRLHALQIVDAYEVFLDGVDAGDETVIRRLAAAQLGIMPRGHEPLAGPVCDCRVRGDQRVSLNSRKRHDIQAIGNGGKR